MTRRPDLRLAALTLALALALPATAQQTYDGPTGLDAPGQHTLSLQDADMDVLIQTVSEITGRSFIVDPRVEGKVTVISAKPMDVDAVWRTFASILRVHGYAVVPAGGMWKVLPEAAAASDGGTAQAEGPEAIVTRVVEVKQVSAPELALILQPLVPSSGKIAAQGSNLVITDRAANVDRLSRLIARIDTAGGSEVEVIPLRHANAAEIARTLTQLDGNAATAAPKLVADARSNSVLLSGDAGQRLRLRTLVAHLDTPLSEGDQTQVIYLRNADAKDLVPVLTTMAATLTNTAAKTETAQPASIEAHAGTNA
ncbi:MAG TPA: secretin N-terminal domain-containing protein, partial [Arenimonas sp.]|nr:secretin N-terminal domain-containing protein [Arenimonas sp.]